MLKKSIAVVCVVVGMLISACGPRPDLVIVPPLDGEWSVVVEEGIEGLSNDFGLLMEFNSDYTVALTFGNMNLRSGFYDDNACGFYRAEGIYSNDVSDITIALLNCEILGLEFSCESDESYSLRYELVGDDLFLYGDQVQQATVDEWETCELPNIDDVDHENTSDTTFDFTADAYGVGATEVSFYNWDFDGDDIVDETTEVGAASYSYSGTEGTVFPQVGIETASGLIYSVSLDAIDTEE